ncbi:MAG: histidine kinase dimerization/phospho-acceptor domain-containing protein [Gemmatimonadota bacterium]
MNGHPTDPPRAISRALLDEIGHELRTPLSSVLGHQELLAEGVLGPLDASVQRAVGRVGVAGRQLAHLIEGALDLGGWLTGNPPAVISAPVDVPELAEDVAGYARELATEDAPWDIESGELSGAFTTDVRRLERVLVLASTAVGKEAAGPIRLRISLAHGAGGGALRAEWQGPAGRWLWLPEASGDPAQVVAASLDAVASEEGAGAPGSWLRSAVAALTATMLGGTMRFRDDPEGGRLEAWIPDLTA